MKILIFQFTLYVILLGFNMLNNVILSEVLASLSAISHPDNLHIFETSILINQSFTQNHSSQHSIMMGSQCSYYHSGSSVVPLLVVQHQTVTELSDIISSKTEMATLYTFTFLSRQKEKKKELLWYFLICGCGILWMIRPSITQSLSYLMSN